ncbi:MAG: hypothetical protein R3F62_18660 [Planctomycetota bacterium]
MRAWILALIVVACTAGCPAPDGPAQVAASLNLDSPDVPRPLKVGDSASLNLTLKRGEVGQLFQPGAFLADDKQQRLTQWHSKPEGVVRFDDDGSRVVFEAPGEVEVWASWSDDDGTPLTSNALRFSVDHSAE